MTTVGLKVLEKSHHFALKSITVFTSFSINRSIALYHKPAILFLSRSIMLDLRSTLSSARNIVQFLLTFSAMTTDGETQKTFVASITRLAQQVQELSWHL